MPVSGTKLRMPRPRRRLVPRDRLITGLLPTREPLAKLVLISAPAGFGKTTLLAQWLDVCVSTRTPAVVCWLSLDPADADPARFLANLLAAIRVGCGQDFGAGAAALLEAQASPELVLVSLVNDLDTVPDRLIIALDDYHSIDSGEIPATVAFLLENLPPQVTLSMTTRADPQLPISRMRARGEVIEVRAADLRFSSDEADAFLNDVMELEIAPDHVAALTRRTEGWVTALQLAALSARNRPASAPDVGAFVAAFGGTHRFVIDYLVDEVLAGLPASTRDFLFATSVLDELSAPLCDVVTGRSDSKATLEALERGNLFVVGTDDVRTWWRYHHLFADALRARVAADDPGRGRRAHARAARWYAESGRLEEAVRHGFTAGSPEHAADLLELALPGFRRRRQDRVLSEWLGEVSDELARRRPLIATTFGWRRLSVGDIAGAERWLDAAAEALARGPSTLATLSPTTPGLASALALRDKEVAGLESMILVYRASCAQARGDHDAVAAHSRAALRRALPDDHFSRGAAAGFLGFAAWTAGDVRTAIETFGNAVRSLSDAGNLADELGATVVLADMWLTRGRPDEARRRYERTLESAASSSHSMPIAADLHVGLAAVLCEQGLLQDARKHLDTARELGDRSALPENRHRRHVATAAVLRASGDLDGAARELEEAAAQYVPGFFPDLQPIGARLARVHIAQGRLHDARRRLNDQGVGVDPDPDFDDEFNQLTRVRLDLADGSFDDFTTLANVVRRANDQGRDGSIVEARILTALARRDCGELEAAVDELEKALQLGVPAGYCRIFLDEGAAMLDLLRLAARRKAVARFATDLLDRVRHASPIVDEPAMSDRLSERELEVLRMLATELSGPEIARRLFVSVNTMRTHTKRIFTKLDVNTRRAAVARATALNLL